MASRCGFYVKDNKIVQQNVEIDWNLGFDKSAKEEYIFRIKDKLGNSVGRMCDVTTACPDYKTRALSPFFVKMKGSDTSVEDYWQMLKVNCHNMDFSRKGLFDWYYLSNLTEEHKETVMEYDCYIDVFHNAGKSGYHNTQARSLAVYRLMRYNNVEYLLNDTAEFLKWYDTIVFVINK